MKSASNHSEQPDIFWIVTDEHRCDGIGAYGNPWIQTPHLNRLASKGVLFENAFCQSPACVASRASFMSGRYPHTTNNMWFDPTADSVPFFTEYMAQAGYHTVNLGKLHHQRKASGFEEHIGLGPREGNPSNLAPQFKEDEAKLGVLRRYSTVKPLIIGGRNPLSGDEAEPAVKVSRAIDYLERRDSATPLLFRLSVLYPHTPVLPPTPFDTLYSPSDMEMPVDSIESKGVPDIEKDVYHEIGGVSEMRREDILKMRAHYYGLCSYVDQQLGRFVDYLENHWNRPYIILFHSDHGNMLGEHGLHEKFNMYEPSRKVPLIIAGHGIPQGKRVKKLVELIDIAPTMLNASGIGIHNSMKLEGRNLIPLMEDESIPWRSFALTEHRIFTPHDIFQHPSLQKYVVTEIDGKKGYEVTRLAKIIEAQKLDWYDLENTGYRYWGPVVKCIRTDRHVMSIRPIWQKGQGDDYMGALYDLEKDPYETNNVFEHPDYGEIREQLIAYCKQCE